MNPMSKTTQMRWKKIKKINMTRENSPISSKQRRISKVKLTKSTMNQMRMKKIMKLCSSDQMIMSSEDPMKETRASEMKRKSPVLFKIVLPKIRI